jgi:hypothetical protein
MTDDSDDADLRAFVPSNYSPLKFTILRNGLTALRHIKADRTWEAWMESLAALRTLAEDLFDELDGEVERGDLEDPTHKSRLRKRWDRYEALAQRRGENVEPLSDQEYWALRYVLMHPEVAAWRAMQDGPKQRKLNHPNNVITKWKAAIRSRNRDPDKPTLAGVLQKDLIATEEELIRVTKERDRLKNETEWAIPEQLAELRTAFVKTLRTCSAREQAAMLRGVADDLGFTDVVRTLVRGRNKL